MSAHGTISRYREGCRCAGCTEANTLARRRYRAGRSIGDLPAIPPPLPECFTQAACRKFPTAWWFPAPGVIHGRKTRGLAVSTPETRRALSICAACPIRERCLDFALETNAVDGIWGGATGAERRRMKRRKVAS